MLLLVLLARLLCEEAYRGKMQDRGLNMDTIT